MGRDPATGRLACVRGLLPAASVDVLVDVLGLQRVQGHGAEDRSQLLDPGGVLRLVGEGLRRHDLKGIAVEQMGDRAQAARASTKKSED
jgi:hypothetical protein